MKKTLFFLSLTLLSISCNDDGVAPVKETNNALVTRISRNGITALEFFYDVDRRLSRVNSYFLGNFSTYILYEYNEDGLKELRRYDADDHSLDYRSVFTLDNFGRVIKAENYSKPDFFDEVASLSKFHYNSSGQLIVKEFSTDGSSFYYREEYDYDADGNLIKQQRTYYPNQDEEYVGSLSEFSPGSQLVPELWENNVFTMGISGFDDEILIMFITEIHYKGWNSNGVLSSESNTEMSGREYDEDGKLTGQVMTRKNVLNPQNPDEVKVMTYEYTKGD